MKLLVLGGTAWLGHLIATTAIDAGHDVTCVARGSSAPDGATLVRADRDHDDALAPVSDTRWDAVIDVAREPGHVRRAVRDLEPVADHYLFVSTTSVYASNERIGADETAERLPPLTADRITAPDDYGPAKAAGEDAVLAGFGPDRSLIARAGLIGGPGDPTGRTDHWPWRFAHPAPAPAPAAAPATGAAPGSAPAPAPTPTTALTPAPATASAPASAPAATPSSDDATSPDASAEVTPGLVLAPEAPGLPTSVIDVRDLAEWLVRCAEQGTSGVMNAMGPVTPFAEHLVAAREAARESDQRAGRPTSADPVVVPASADWLLAHDVGQWAGPRSLPLWIADPAWHGMNARSIDRARSAGLTHRLLVDTLRDALDHRSSGPDADDRPSGLSDGDHAALLAELLAP